MVRGGRTADAPLPLLLWHAEDALADAADAVARLDGVVSRAIPALGCMAIRLRAARVSALAASASVARLTLALACGPA